MAKITFKGTPITTSGELPALGTLAPDFVLTKGDLSDVSLGDFAGKKKILNIVPSLDTSVCALSARAFNQKIKTRTDTVVLNISADLPFAQSRFCKENDLENIIPLSQMRSRDFGQSYGVVQTSGPLAGILARAVVVLSEDNKVVYTELIPEITQEPRYDDALAALG